MEMKREEIEHVASLSMLNLSEEEIAGYTKDMEQIVTFVNQINEVNTEAIEESAFASDSANVFRKDEVRASFDRELLLSNAPSGNGEAFSIPNVLNE